MEIVKIPVIRTAEALIQYLKGLTPSDHFKIAKSVGIRPKDKADAHLYADYIVQGITKGLVGPALVQYAETNVARLQTIMPHLKAKAQPAPKRTRKPKIRMPGRYIKAATGQVGSAAANAPAPTKPVQSKSAPLRRVKYEDFAIVARPDRGGFEGWYGRKAEAFRPTKEKVEAFFLKKYNHKGPFKVVY